jgi:hypothetical protein
MRETGIVTAACQASGLSRRTAYRHFSNDGGFAAEWVDAIDEANDSLVKEVRTRALDS